MYLLELRRQLHSRTTNGDKVRGCSAKREFVLARDRQCESTVSADYDTSSLPPVGDERRTKGTWLEDFCDRCKLILRLIGLAVFFLRRLAPRERHAHDAVQALVGFLLFLLREASGTIAAYSM